VAGPDHLLRAVVPGQQPIAHIEILDCHLAALGPEARAGREADHRRPVVRRADRRAVGTGDDRVVALGAGMPSGNNSTGGAPSSTAMGTTV
jgi:hypothetical protein